MPLDLKGRQIDALKCMLNFNSPETRSLDYEKLWKILVCDKCGLDIISAIFTKSEIKELGVTITLSITSEREAIPDVPAIYFILPTAENAGKLAKDIESGMYESYFINFISPVSRDKLETIAYTAYQTDCVEQIPKIYDQYTNFICLEENLFVLHDDKIQSMSYASLNRPGVTDREMDAMINSVTEGLLAVCVTMGTVPIIRCQGGNAADMVAQRLNKKIHDSLKDSRSNLFDNSGSSSHHKMSFERPLLVILDRSLDLATPLHHPWTYQALVHDLLGLRHNSVTLPASTSSGKKTAAQTYDLWCDSDEFWRDERHKPLPEIADVIQQQLEQVKAKDREIVALRNSMESESAPSGDNGNKLGETVSTLGGFLKKKKLVEIHTNIATYLVDQIKERKLDLFFELEEKLQAKQQLQEKSVLDLISSPEGSERDKLRLLLLALLYGGGSASNSTRELSSSELDQLCGVLLTGSTSPDTASLVTDAVKYIRSFTSLINGGGAGASSSNGSSAVNYGGGSSSAGGGLFTKFISHGHAYFMEGVKSLVAKKHKLPMTKIVHNLMEQNQSSETDHFKYYDPKFYKYSDSQNIPRQKATFQEAVVFVVGGGCYSEYRNLVDYSRSPRTGGYHQTGPETRQKRITYGSTEVLSGEQFLTQLAGLGAMK